MLNRRESASKSRGVGVLRDPQLNRSLAFTEAERDALGLHGLLPAAVDSEELALDRVEHQLESRSSDLERYIYLSDLQDRDEDLFYRLLRSDPVRFLPLIYTPTVGEACLQWSHIFRRPRGLYLSITQSGRVREMLRNWPEREVRFAVVTSGERILGLGDLGANGMGIPIGKLALYSALAGVPPRLVLPILMDCGTNNETLLADPLYIGVRRRRCSTAELDDFVAEFVTAIRDEFPDCCIQWEDWARADAFRLLAGYRDRICSFNDDIQGSGAVALAGVMAAMRITGGRLPTQTFLFLGAGSAAVGIADMLVQAMIADGLTVARARERIWLFNRGGLLAAARSDLTAYQRPYAHPHPPVRSFLDAIDSIRPTAIIGVSSAPGAFAQRVVAAIARYHPRPIIFALSNPTSRSECTAEDAYRWSRGRAIFASGSPFSAVSFEGRNFVPGQCNNVYIFPAVGQAIFKTRARRVTDEIFIEAARALAQLVTTAELEAGLIYPPLSAIVDTEARIAERVALAIRTQGLAGD